MEYEIQCINFGSVIKFLFVVFFIIGACCSFFYILILSILGNVIQALSGEIVESEFVSFSGISIFLQVVSFSIFSSIVGCFVGAIFIGIYNLVSHLFGGIKIELVSTKNKDVVTVETRSNHTNTHVNLM